MNLRKNSIVGILILAGAVAGYGVKAVRAGGIPNTNPLYYSGPLTENGQLVTGARPLTVSLFADDMATNPLCQTVAADARVLGGRFRIPLAAACVAGLQQNANAFVEVVAGTTNLGRSKIGAVPYAVETQHAASADTSPSADGELKARLDAIAKITEWEPFTPRVSLGTVDQPAVPTKGYFRRVGDTVEVQVSIDDLTPLTGDGTLYVQLPAPLTPANNKLVPWSKLGGGNLYSGTQNSSRILAVFYSAGLGRFGMHIDAPQGVGINVGTSSPYNLRTNATNVQISFKSPVAGWTSTTP